MELFGQRLKFLNDDQLQALGRQSNKGSTWSAETIKQALQIKFSCGKTGDRPMWTTFFILCIVSFFFQVTLAFNKVF